MTSLLGKLVPARFHPSAYLRKVVENETGGRIYAGPFKGMDYGTDSCGSRLWPKIVGTYELELQQVVETIVEKGYGLIIDIGAAEGYYACGLALRLPKSRIVAFEADVRGRYLLQRTVSLNNVSRRVEMKGMCDPNSFVEALSAGAVDTLVICDAEGAEFDLLDPAIAPLGGTAILVETHDFCLPGISELLQQRFRATHDITEIAAHERRREHFPLRDHDGYIRWLPTKYYMTYMDEARPSGMRWLWMRPKQSDSRIV